MDFCKECGHEIGNNRFCEQCGAEFEDSSEKGNSNDKTHESSKLSNRKKIFFVSGGIISFVIAIIIFLVVDPLHVQNKDTLKEVQGVETNVHEDIIVKEESEGDSNTDLFDTTGFALKTKDVLNAIEKGSIMGAVHLGQTEQDLIEEAGEPINIDEIDGERRLEYPDSLYTVSDVNGLVYSAILKPVHSLSIGFKDIEEYLGEGNEAVKKEFDKETNGLYTLSYGTEDSLSIFYSPTKDGESIVQMKFSNASIYGANIEKASNAKPVNPGEIEPIILEIRKQFNEINNTDTLRETKEMITTESNRKVVSVSQGGKVRKAIEATSGGTAEYYFDEEEHLLFVFLFKGTIENRFYFWNDQLVRWINEAGTIMDYYEGHQKTQYSAWQKRWLDTAYDLDYSNNE